MSIRIDFCSRGEIGELMQFIDEHWKRGHALARSRELMDWQHLDRTNDRYNYVLARDDSNGGAIVGMLGFIPQSRFDRAFAAVDTLWLTTWKVRADVAQPALGLRLHAFLERSCPHEAIGTVGNNAVVEKIYRALGYTTGTLTRFVLTAANLRNPVLLAGPMPASKAPSAPDPGLSVTEVALADLAAERLSPAFERVLASGMPRRSVEFVLERYARHPFYSYRGLGLARADGLACLAVYRVAEHGGARAIRVVDLLGDEGAFAGAGAALQAWVARHEAEFADLFALGLDERPLRAAGFSIHGPADDLVVPSYFEPYEARNVELRFAFKPRSPREASVRLFKGDCDQDRPNLLTS